MGRGVGLVVGGQATRGADGFRFDTWAWAWVKECRVVRTDAKPLEDGSWERLWGGSGIDPVDSSFEVVFPRVERKAGRGGLPQVDAR